MEESESQVSSRILKELESVKEKRGYLMPHHGLLALTAPNLLNGYDACYSALTLQNRELCEREKEFVWLGILAVKQEHLATQHLTKYLQAGGEIADITVAVRIASFAMGTDIYSFAERYWNDKVKTLSAQDAYFESLKLLYKETNISTRLIQLTMCAIHTSIKNWSALAWHIENAYSLEIPEKHIAEALTYSMFTGSIPNFIEGCGVWQKMIKDQKVNASPEFIAWASIDQLGP